MRTLRKNIPQIILKLLEGHINVNDVRPSGRYRISGRASSYTGNESGNTEYGGKFALAISGLTVGEQYTFSYKLSAFAFGEAEYSDASRLGFP